MKHTRGDKLLQGILMIINLTICTVFMYIVMTYTLPAGSWISVVDGSSMYPALEDGQFIYTDKSEIKRGDIVLLKMPEAVVEAYPKRQKGHW